MGAVLSSILPNNTGRVDDPDPVTGLTSRDKYLVANSWAKFMKNGTDNGVTLLALFFEKYPQYIQLFPFKDLPQSEFKTNVRFRAHANRVVYALASFVDSLNDNDLLVQLLTKTGTSHAPRNVTAEGFIHLKDVAIELFSTLYKPDEMEAWKKTLDVAFDVIIKGLKSEEEGNETMGVIVSYFRGDEGRTDDPDPVTGLASRDKYVLRTSWKRITDGQANLETGMSIFLSLFAKHPEYHQLFPFRDIPRDQLKSNNKFRAHCISLMYAFASIVDNIDNPPVLEELLAKQGISHVPRKVPSHAYWDLKVTLLELFAKAMNEEEVKTWDKFLDLGFKIMVKNAEEAKKN